MLLTHAQGLRRNKIIITYIKVTQNELIAQKHKWKSILGPPIRQKDLRSTTWIGVNKYFGTSFALKDNMLLWGSTEGKGPYASFCANTRLWHDLQKPGRQALLGAPGFISTARCRSKELSLGWNPAPTLTAVTMVASEITQVSSTNHWGVTNHPYVWEVDSSETR